MKTKFFGLGAAGNKAAIKILEDGLCSKDELILVNSTKKDIPYDFDGKSTIFNTTGGGCGKERSVAKQYAIDAIKAGKFDDAFQESDESYVFITSLEGGTGSGATPIIAKYCSEVLGKIVHIVAFAGFNDDARGLQNSVEFFQEIDFECDVQCIDLKSFMSAAGGNHLRAEELADEELVRRINVLLGKNIIASSQNIDAVDLMKLINTSGYKTIEHISFKDDLVDVNQFNQLCKKMIYASKSLKSNNPAQLRLGVILNIKPESEDAIDYDFKVIKDAFGFPYEKFLHKQYDGGEQYIEFISSGMKLPIDEIKAIHQKYLEESARVNKTADEFFEEVQNLGKNQEDVRFDMVSATKKPTISKADFFGDI
ncbi:MAG: hypothetical protein J6Y02_19865 [Pseudobutyrivibrio sp.]|nr:hypothetical protein [Pseudobutyrivibrio sp.]